MAAASWIDHRLAFVGLAGLLLGAAVPLAFAWARLIPEDAGPFRIEPGSFPSVDHEAPHEEIPKTRTDFIAIALLLFVTAAFVIRFPGFPGGRIVEWLGGLVSGPTEDGILFASQVGLILATVGGGVYGGFRKGPLRVPMIAAAVLILILWFVGPILMAGLLSGS
jgi:hypothetical protein